MSARADGASCAATAPAFTANGGNIGLDAPTRGNPFEILAIGSSSTEGVGASSPERAYPARLAADLRTQGGLAVDMRNAGVGGEIAETTLVRLKAALASGRPQLVIWQVGTNDALTGVDENRFRGVLEDGVQAARAAGVPIILIDPQFTPKEAGDARYRHFAEIVDGVGAARHAPVLSRYAMMKAIAQGAGDGIAPLLAKDGLHMSDLGYSCLAAALAKPIEDAVAAKASAGQRL